MSNLLSDGITVEGERKILRIFFPGLLATWPLWIATLLFMERAPIWGVVISGNGDDTIFKIVFYFIAFIFIYGIGHLISKIALRIETFLDMWCSNCAEVELEEKSRLYRWCAMAFIWCLGKAKEPIDPVVFEDTWYAYLQKSFQKDKEPTIIRYYSSFITAYHFELSTIVAIILQLILVVAFDWNYSNLLSPLGNRAIFIISILAVWYLIREAKSATKTAHHLRVKLLRLKLNCSRPMEDQKLKATAYHEAGHAVIALYFQLPFETAYVTIVPDEQEGSLGHFSGESSKTLIFGQFEEDDMEFVDDYEKKKVIQLLAGRIAERKITGIDNKEGSGSDDKKINNILFGTDPDLDIPSEYNKREKETEIILNEPIIWNIVGGVVEELLKKRTIQFSEVERIYNEHYK